MTRSKDPSIKKDLLEKCLSVVAEKGTIDLSIHHLAELTGTSARMLIYHFGSKAELDEKISIALDESLRLKFQEFAARYADENHRFVLKFWEYLISDTTFLKLSALYLTLFNESTQKKSLRKAMDRQTEAWLDILEKHVKSRTFAEMAFLMGQGAFIDFLTTGNKERGQHAIEKLLKLMK